jgi:hypothetical protein
MGYNGKIVDLSKYEVKKEVELSRMEVELNANQEARDAIKEAKAARLKVEDTKKVVESAVQKLKADYKDLSTKSSNAALKIEVFQKLAKDLGLDAPSDLKSDLGLMKDHRKLGDSMQATLTKITL